MKNAANPSIKERSAAYLYLNLSWWILENSVINSCEHSTAVYRYRRSPAGTSPAHDSLVLIIDIVDKGIEQVTICHSLDFESRFLSYILNTLCLQLVVEAMIIFRITVAPYVLSTCCLSLDYPSGLPSKEYS